MSYYVYYVYSREEKKKKNCVASEKKAFGNVRTPNAITKGTPTMINNNFQAIEKHNFAFIVLLCCC